ncbi:acyltransferase [Motilimonas sp. E26]|uniref:acyltransferase n=1 Tax=Motilimonas sp. E26 TaxID=2865674 RepID=UPI001E3659A9|nr:acyltransferase [Motilimonas sp. E26]MCE0558570.1 acyltransferase [Motilimonas sp. E26]
MLIFEIVKKIKFCIDTDRIGPDIPFTHWMLHYKSKMRKLCSKKFKYFAITADFRSGAYAISCSNICIGENVVIRPLTMLFADEFAQIVIENNVMIGAGVHFYVNNHRFDRRDIPLIEQGYYPSKDVIVKEGAWIGANSIILPGVTVGKNSVIGAGAVVTKSIPDFCVAVGNPAKIIKELK